MSDVRALYDLLRKVSMNVRDKATYQKGGYPDETLLAVADAIDEVLDATS